MTIARQILPRIAVIALLAAIIWAILPPRRGYRYEVQRVTCHYNLKKIMLAVAQYRLDADGRYPLVLGADRHTPGNRSYGWATSIQPYLKEPQIFQCPTQALVPETRQPMRAEFTDYYFNLRLAGKAHGAIMQPSGVVMLGEGNDGQDDSNARYALSRIPEEWLVNESSPLYRHFDGANYAFAAGHVKWVRASAPPGLARPKDGVFTFLVE